MAEFLRSAGADARLEQLDVSAASAEAAADAVGCTLGGIVKSLVLLCDGRPVLALVPGGRRADTAKVARLMNAKKVRIAGPEDVRQATGFAPGGVAPFPSIGITEVLVDRDFMRHELVWAGAGSEHHLVALAPLELVRLTRGRIEDLTQDDSA